MPDSNDSTTKSTDKFEIIKKKVKKALSCKAHDFEHIMRVHNLCIKLANTKKLDIEVLKAAALLHDIGRVKEDEDPRGKTDHAVVSARMAGRILPKLDFSKGQIKHIKECIISHRYKTENVPQTIEAKILFDADKIDCLGAIGIFRAAMWVNANNAQVFRKPDLNEYIDDNLGGKINGKIQDITKHSMQIEYATKTKFLPEKLFTLEGRRIAKTRLAYLTKFLIKLENEVKGLE